LVCKISFHLVTGAGTPTPIIEHHDAWSFSKCMTRVYTLLFLTSKTSAFINQKELGPWLIIIWRDYKTLQVFTWS
jgi:hypothetical protein